MTIICYTSAVRAKRGSAALSLRAVHTLSVGDDDDDTTHSLSGAPPADIAVVARANIVFTAAWRLARKFQPDEASRRIPAVYISQYFKKNAHALGMNTVSDVYRDEDDLRLKVSVTPRFCLVDEAVTASATLLSVDLLFGYSYDTRPSDLPELQDNHSLLHQLLCEVNWKFVSYHLAGRYPSIFGPLPMRLDADKRYFSRMARSVMRVSNRSSNEPFRTQVDRYMRAIKNRLNDWAAKAQDALSDHLTPVLSDNSSVFQDQDGLDDVDSMQVICLALERLLKLGVRPKRFKGENVDVKDVHDYLRNASRDLTASTLSPPPLNDEPLLPISSLEYSFDSLPFPSRCEDACFDPADLFEDDLLIEESLEEDDSVLFGYSSGQGTDSDSEFLWSSSPPLLTPDSTNASASLSDFCCPSESLLEDVTDTETDPCMRPQGAQLCYDSDPQVVLQSIVSPMQPKTRLEHGRTFSMDCDLCDGSEFALSSDLTTLTARAVDHGSQRQLEDNSLASCDDCLCRDEEPAPCFQEDDYSSDDLGLMEFADHGTGSLQPKACYAPDTIMNDSCQDTSFDRLEHIESDCDCTWQQNGQGPSTKNRSSSPPLNFDSGEERRAPQQDPGQGMRDLFCRPPFRVVRAISCGPESDDARRSGPWTVSDGLELDSDYSEHDGGGWKAETRVDANII